MNKKRKSILLYILCVTLLIFVLVGGYIGYILSRFPDDNPYLYEEITSAELSETPPPLHFYEEITNAELSATPQQRDDPLIFEQLIFESSKLDQIIKKCLGDVKDSLMHLDSVKKLKSDSVYHDLRNQCKGIYNEFKPIVKNIIEYCMADGKKNSWPGEDEAIRQSRSEYAKTKNKKYNELRVWEIKNESLENNQTHTYVEMRLNGMGHGRIVQMKDKQKDGYYINFYNQKPLIIREVVLGKKEGLELSFYKNSDALETFATYVEGRVMGPAFFWFQLGNIIQFEYFSQPTQRITIWPPDIRLKNN
ncbi:MAG: hypothetical protein JXR73_13610 [Candidatus Omnitrophica bacterium]|nr:hypothetical protein [Candidatus Omnitrophota bacterium]